MFGDDGQYCFASDIFKKLFQHKILVKDVVRQRESNLIKAVAESLAGNLGPDSQKFIETLNRPHGKDVTMLFATNELVDDFNRRIFWNIMVSSMNSDQRTQEKKRYLDLLN